MKKLVYSSTVPMSLNIFCRGLLHDMSYYCEVVAASSPGKELDEIADREHVRCIPVEMHREISPLADLRSLFRLIHLYRQEKPDAVHSFTPKAGLLCMMAAKIARMPVRIHTFTGLVWPTSTGIKRRIIRVTDKLTCACATHIIAEGQGVRSDLLNGDITHKPVEVLGYGNVRGIDLNYWQPAAKAETKDNTTPSLRFIFVGRLVPDKGINELIQAFQQILDIYPTCTLTLVGWYEDETPLPARTRQAIDTTSAIHYVGRQDDVRPFYQEADCLVFPSYREGFPNVVLEAGAMGLPAIVTDINGSREIIRQGENGIIIPPRDAEQLLNAMRYMVEHPDERKHMADASRPLVATRFDQKYVRKCQIDYYKRIF